MTVSKVTTAVFTTPAVQDIYTDPISWKNSQYCDRQNFTGFHSYGLQYFILGMVFF